MHVVGQILPVASLLLGTACLLFAGGIHGLILPLRGGAEGFSALTLGLLGTFWAFGYAAGCLATPGIVARVGHIRAFGVMCAFAAISILGALLVIAPWPWVILRAVAGLCFAGAAMIVESWLSERAGPATRGRIFGLYMMVTLLASTGGQLSVALGPPELAYAGHVFFVVAAMAYCLALVPTALSTTATPAPLVSVRLDLGGLWRNSPVAVVAVFCVGVANGSFGTLAPVYAERTGLVLTTIALFSSLPVLAGVLAQVPVGALSDRVDRRFVLVGLAVAALAADAVFLWLAPEGRAANLALAALLGACLFSMYPVILAHANDHAAPGSFIQVSGGLLLVFGLGSIVGPLAAGAAMTDRAPNMLYIVTAAAHGVIILFGLWRIARSKKVADAEKGDFVAIPSVRAATPETAVLAQPHVEADAAEAAARDDGDPDDTGHGPPIPPP